MIEAWIGDVIGTTVAHYADNKSGQRHLQTGVAWTAWQRTFGHAALSDWPHLLNSLMRFAGYAGSQSEWIAHAFASMSYEDRFAEDESERFSPDPSRESEISAEFLTTKMHAMQRRLSEWIEAIVHWSVHWKAAVVPIAFRQGEEQRELVDLGLIQKCYIHLSDEGRKWWQFRHEDLAHRFAGSPDWSILGQAQSFEKFGALSRPDIDELTIHWWPLLTRHEWTDRDMCGLIRNVVKNPSAYPLREDKEFADYRKKALGLVKIKDRRGKSAPDGLPKGWKVAYAKIGRLSE
ncbi:MAG: hypothetical protein KDN18_18155 [Verrucomicrobiae bacterium]|nr:hypothetical protein [Verrucomicrobiae bacterium]